MVDTVQSAKPFGYLFTMDLYDCKSGVCDDFDLCYTFLERVVQELHMQKQSPPYIFRSDRRLYPDKAGISGWIPLIESGIQIHTLSSRNFILIDIYSCREFQTDKLEDFSFQERLKHISSLGEQDIIVK